MKIKKFIIIQSKIKFFEINFKIFSLKSISQINMGWPLNHYVTTPKSLKKKNYIFNIFNNSDRDINKILFIKDILIKWDLLFK